MKSTNNKLKIPVIDLSLDNKQLSENVTYAVENFGFFNIINHEIPHQVIVRTINDCKRFFSLSDSIKNKINCKKHNGARGYFFKGQENLNNVINLQRLESINENNLNNIIDNKEGYDMANNATGPNFNECNIFGTPTPWPPEQDIPGFHNNMEEYHFMMNKLANRLLTIISISLNLEPDFFKDKFDKPVSTLRLLHYFNNSSINSISAGSHTDYGGLTILLQESPGLQILKDKMWINVPTSDKILTVNIGDMMMRWTNYRYISSIHRVINLNNKERFSITFFFNTNLDTEINLKKNDKNITCRKILYQFYQKSGLIK